MFNLKTFFFILLWVFLYTQAENDNEKFVHLSVRAPILKYGPEGSSYESNYNYFPFNNGNYSFYARGVGTLQIQLTPYPFVHASPHYLINLEALSTAIYYDGTQIYYSSNNSGLLSQAYTLFEVAIEQEGAANYLIVKNVYPTLPDVYPNIRLPIDVFLPMTYIGFGSSFGFTSTPPHLDVMFDIHQIKNNM